MKRILASALALPLSLGLLAGTAMAQPGNGKPLTEKQAQCRAERHAKMDLNGDGTVEKSERRAARKARKDALWAKFDSNRDGALSNQERAAMKKARGAERFAKLDGNGDGVISQIEADAACGPIGRFFSKLDADGSGTITKAEFESMKEMKRHHRGGRGHKGKRGMHGGGELK